MSAQRTRLPLALRVAACHNSGVSDLERQRVLALLKRFGREATSFQLLEPGLRYWFDGDDACIAYCEVPGAWVTAGEPLCAPAQRRAVVERFSEAAERAGKRVRFFYVTEAFWKEARLWGTHVGEQPCWDPSEWESTLTATKSLREQLRRAKAKGVSVREVPGSELSDPANPLRVACDALIRRWLSARGMHEMKFMVLVHPFSFAEERRYVIAERDGALVGFAASVPIYQGDGWFLEDLIRAEDAPNGTAELLVDRTMRMIAKEGARYFTLGLAPLSGEVSPLLAFTRRHTRSLYNFSGVQRFKEKLRPRAWEPVYLAFPRGELGVVAMADVLAAFAPSGLLSFALDTLVHQRKLATGVLALLLVPWTLLISFADTSVWFPSPGVKLAWVAFDLLLIALMGSLVVKWRARVADWLSLLTRLDALLTTLQVLFWNVWTARTAGQWSLLVLGCTGPLLASLFFRRARLLSLRAGPRGQLGVPYARFSGARGKA